MRIFKELNYFFLFLSPVENKSGTCAFPICSLFVDVNQFALEVEHVVGANWRMALKQ